MRYHQKRSAGPITMAAKYAGTCRCCGAAIKRGEIVDYYPALRAIAHTGGLDGNSPRCTSEIRNARDPSFVDVDAMYEDQCADICGR